MKVNHFHSVNQSVNQSMIFRGGLLAREVGLFLDICAAAPST